ncbi:MAG: SGNH/GDSL hydrolase family protein [Rhodoferax sp.]|uniref:SGNH/GDSL hydrolase family protein n=1 Tax=Rhodoferax sp. TaxID=50421 RepID=UPI003018D315
MRQFKILATALGAALLVAACGGGGNGDQSPAIKYSSVVSFGDSLSDAGTYAVPSIKGLGGGMFTVNGIAGAVGADPTPSYNWAQLVSAAAIGKVSCSARLGGFGALESIVLGCTNYAQGGSRVTDGVGTNNTVAGAALVAAGAATPGPLTESVLTQIASFVADNNGNFKGTELVTMLAGANDIFGQTDKLKTDATAAGTAEGARVGALTFGNALVGALAAGATDPATAAQAIGLAMQTESARTGSTSASVVGAAVGAAAIQPGNSAVGAPAVYGPMVAAATTAATTAGATAGAAFGANYAATTGAGIAVAGMTTAAATLATYIKDMVNNKGAKHIVVVNLPDVSQTPMAMATPTSQQQLVLAMTMAFNTELQKLEGTPGVLMVDAFAENRRQLATPAHYALTNVKDVACNLNYGFNPLATLGNADGSSLACKSSNLVAGDSSHYLFADGVHPTPYGHKLLAQYVTKAMVIAGWL